MRFLFLLLMFCAVPICAWASQDSARQMVNHLYITSGQLPVKDMVIELEEMSTSDTGRMELGSKDRIYFLAPNKIRVDSVMIDPDGALDGKSVTIIRDGTNAWQYLANGQFPVKKAKDVPVAPLNIPFGVVRYQEFMEKTFALDGTETLDGVTCQKVKISGGGEVSVVWIDNTRHIPLKLTIEKKVKDKTVKRRIQYKDVGKTQDGRFFPMKVEVYTNDVLDRIVTYKGLVVNSGVKESLFEPMEKLLK